MKVISGGCLCGSVKYGVSAEPLMTLICHCSDCQKQSGSAFSTNVLFPAGSISVDGQLSEFGKPGDIGSQSGSTTIRKFCGKCGSALFTDVTAHPEFTIVKAGTLDDKVGLRPAAQIYCDRKQEWLQLQAGEQYPLFASAEELFASTD